MAKRRELTQSLQEPERASEAMISRCRREIESKYKRMLRSLLVAGLKRRKRLAEVGEGFQWDLLAGLKVSPDSRLGRYAYLGGGFEAQGPICVGDLVMIAANCKVVGSDHDHRHFRVATRLAFDLSPRPVTSFGVDVWVGHSAIIREGLTISRGAVIAAGAVVTRDLPPYSIAAGVPARIVGRRFKFDEVLTHDAFVCQKPLSREDVRC